MKNSILIVLSLVFAFLFPMASLGATDKVSKQYRLAKGRYNTLLEIRGQGGERAQWQAVLRVFQNISQEHPKHDKAAASLYLAGMVSHASHARFQNPLDLGEAIISLKDLATLYPQHPLADDALFFLSNIYLTDKGKPDLASRTLAKVIAVYPQGDMASRAIEKLKRIKGKSPLVLESTAKKVAKNRLAKVRPVRFWTTTGYTRVVIETTAPVRYQDSIVKQGGSNTRKLAVDLVGSKVSEEQQVDVGDGLLQMITSQQKSLDTTRILLSTLAEVDYNIFNLDDPYRVVIDIAEKVDEIKVDSTKVFGNEAPSLAQQLGLGIRRIVLDPGHGGRDPGAIGFYGLKEKNITLKVAKAAADYLKKQGEFDVVLTRDKDRFLALEERTAIANTKGADLFVSIHVNASPKQKTKGIETYFLDLARTEDAMRVAALENATSTRELSDLQDLLLDLMQSAKMEESSLLAKKVQHSMATGVAEKFTQVENLGVKRAPFVVLIGARMPAILIEVGFLTNPIEAGRLKSDTYLNTLAIQVGEGITRYAKELSLAEK